jgi:hypothetical protein
MVWLTFGCWLLAFELLALVQQPKAFVQWLSSLLFCTMDFVFEFISFLFFTAKKRNRKSSPLRRNTLKL